MNEHSDHPASVDPADLLGECDIRRTRRSGPGGQRRNKVETAVVLQHRPTGIQAEASESRSPSANQRQALSRLRMKLALAVRRRVDWQTAASPRWLARCRNRRIFVSAQHPDYPALVAEALDTLFAAEMDFHRSSERLACTPTQLVRFCKNEPQVWNLVTRRRCELGLPQLK